MTIRRKISIITAGFLLLMSLTLYVYNKIYLSFGEATEIKTIVIEKGDNAFDVGKKLSDEKVISGKYYLMVYLWKKGDIRKIIAGTYEFKPGLKISEVAKIITGGEIASSRIKITFPEGWTNKDIAEKLKANGYSDEEFLKIVNNPSQELKDKYPFLKSLPKGKSLEGYLFPDTYYFAKDASSNDIIEKMLKNFSERISPTLLAEISRQQKTLFEIITLASIVEGEVSTDEDRKLVAGLFWNRLKIGQPMQSDATLEYILGNNKFQHSTAETKIDSPYNTYKYKGLPPGPVNNPGISSITATISPDVTDFNYFLTDPKTGQTIFSKTYDEHLANKAKYGL